MFNRAGAAACAVAIAGMLLVPVPVSARGGGGGHPGGFRPIVRPMHRVHPPIARPVHPIHHPNVRPVHRVHPPFAHRHPFARREFHDRHGFHALARRHHRAIFGLPFYGYGLPVTYAPDDSAFYGSYYDPSDVTGSIVVPPYPVPPPPISPLAGLPEPAPERVGCRSQTVAVPSPSGPERTVTITRC
jgi:hypothetical protein